jgi:hypothetical protein
VKGQKVQTLMNEILPAGTHKTVWNAAGKASGVYFIRLSVGNTHKIKRVLLMK